MTFVTNVTADPIRERPGSKTRHISGSARLKASLMAKTRSRAVGKGAGWTVWKDQLETHSGDVHHSIK